VETVSERRAVNSGQRRISAPMAIAPWIPIKSCTAAAYFFPRERLSAEWIRIRQKNRKAVRISSRTVYERDAVDQLRAISQTIGRDEAVRPAS